MGLLSTIGAASGRAFGFTRSAIAAATDAFFNSVTLLLPGNGTNGAQNNTFLDSSSNNFTITRNGNTTQGTFSPFSQTGWSVQFDRADYNNLLISSSSDFDFSSGNFTIEMWINPQSLPAAGDGSFHFIFATTNLVSFFFSGNIYFRNQATTELVTVVPHGMVQNVWYHLAFVRSGSNYTIYRNGSSLTTGSGGTVASGASALSIAGSTGFNGITACTLSNFRITNGQALYTSTFTPSTSPLTTTSQGATASNVKLLTCQSNRFVDNSTQNTKTIQFGSGTTLGVRSIQAFSPFAPTAAYSAATVGGSGYFDGTGDYLNVASNTALTFGTGDFTVEGWFYANALGGQPTILNNGSDAAGLVITMLSSKIYAYFVGAGNVFGSSGATIVTNTWYHFAWVRSGSTNTFYLNGAVYGATYSSAGNHSSTGGVGIGYSVAGTAFAAWNGYIADVRMVKGTAVYTTTFTPPTAPLTAITNTSLLTNFTNAGITDATAKHVFETVGNSQISTTQSKWGGGSLYFDGTGDGLFIPPPQKELLRFGTGDFTIEFWAWKSANGSMGYDTVISIGTDGNFSGGFSVELSNTRGFCFVYDAAVRISASLNPNDSTWHHYAVVRSGSTFSLYQDGTRVSTGTLTPTLGITGNGYIGAGAGSTGSNFNGYIDDLRVTRGYARYSGTSFTVPTAAYPTQ